MERDDWRETDITGREAVREWAAGFRNLAAAARAAGLGSSGRTRLRAYLRAGSGLGMPRARLIATASGIPFVGVFIPDEPIRRLLELGLDGPGVSE